MLLRASNQLCILHEVLSQSGVTYAELTLSGRRYDYCRLTDDRAHWGPRTEQPLELALPRARLRHRPFTTSGTLHGEGVGIDLERLGVTHALLTMDSGEHFEFTASGTEFRPTGIEDLVPDPE